jgi:YD repeat-containing protein
MMISQKIKLFTRKQNTSISLSYEALDYVLPSVACYQSSITHPPVDLEQDYAPPDVGTGGNSTTFTYNPDKQLTLITRLDGKAEVFLLLILLRN